MPIPLRTRAFWSVYHALEFRPTMQQPPERVRAAAELRKKSIKLPGTSLLVGRLDKAVETTDTSFTTADGAEIPLRVYRPRASSARELPVVVNFHGGGWVSGDVQQSQWWCGAVAAGANVVVVSVEYRLAPEHPFPVPAEDCYEATAWVHDHADDLGVDADRIAVMGDSAGGNLAAAVCLMARDRGGPPIGLQILIYPSVRLGANFPSETENAAAPILGKADLDNVPGLYFHGSDRTQDDPYASPLNGKHEDLPPAFIQTAQYDPLRDHGYEYASALRAAGVEVRHTNYVDAVHGYISLPGIMPTARQAAGETVEELRRRFG